MYEALLIGGVVLVLMLAVVVAALGWLGLCFVREAWAHYSTHQ